MLVSYKNKKLLLPFDANTYYWWSRNGATVRFYGVPVFEDNHSRRESLMICAKCGTHAGLHYHYQDGIKCPNCDNVYQNGYYGKQFNAWIINCLIGLPRVRKNKVSFDLYEYAENTTNHIWEPEVFYTIRYSREGGLETIPALGKRAKPIHHLTSSRAQLGEEHVQKIVKAFERVHPGNGLREMLYDKRREKCSLDIKVIIQYFYYLGKYPQLEQLVKAGYGAVIRDILQFSPQVVNKRIKHLFKSATREKNIVELPSFIREFIKTDPQMNDKRMLAMERLYKAIPNMSREDFEMFQKAFPRYLIATDYIIRFLADGEYTFREVCKLVLGSKKSSGPKELLRYQKDYIRMCKQMEVPYERFPKDIRKLHDAVSANYRVKQDQFKAQAFEKKCDEYKEVSITSDRYFIRFPNDLADLIMEGSTMHHCVASYADRVIDGTSIIFFMRKAEDPETPYITMEFDRKGDLVQARKSRNATIANTEESAFIRQFQKEILIPNIRSKKAA